MSLKLPTRDMNGFSGTRAFRDRRRRSLLIRLARRFEFVQSLYEAKKNRTRGAILGSLISPGGVGAELGVFKGQFSMTLVRALRPEHIYIVDPWYLLGASWPWAAGDRSTVNALRKVFGRMRLELESGRATVVVVDDREFLARLPDSTFDWVYLDSSHAYEHTKSELALLVRKVRVDGVIAGDDWRSDETHRHHGVCKAVREYVDSGELAEILFDEESHQWVTRVVKGAASQRMTDLLDGVDHAS